MIESGEIITLDNNKEYICYSTIKENDVNYVYLLSNFKPVEIKFGIQRLINGNIQIEIINDVDQKKKLLDLFSMQQRRP